jgi:hypothetical protein
MIKKIFLTPKIKLKIKVKMKTKILMLLRMVIPKIIIQIFLILK